jgi:hypothetical protein
VDLLKFVFVDRDIVPLPDLVAAALVLGNDDAADLLVSAPRRWRGRV